MDRRAVYLRTSKGLKELMGRTSLLGSTDRNILFLVTGKVTLGEIEARLDPSLKMRLQATIDRLVREEFIYLPGPAEMGSETDITNGTLIDPLRGSSTARAGGRPQATAEENLSAVSDDLINETLRRAHNESRRQSIVDRLQQVESLAVSAGTATAERRTSNQPSTPDVTSGHSVVAGAPAALAPSLNPLLVLARTAKGAQEFIGRSQTLPPTLSKLLHLVDGEANVATIVARTGDPDGRVVGLGIQKLLRDGYVQETTLAIKNLVPAEDFETTLEHSAAIARQGPATQITQPVSSPAADHDAQVSAPSAYEEVAQALADHAAMEARVERAAKVAIARAAMPKEAPSAVQAPAAAAAVPQADQALRDEGEKRQSRRRSQRHDRVAQVESPAITHSVDPDNAVQEPIRKRRLSMPLPAVLAFALVLAAGAATYWLWPMFDANHYAQAAGRFLGRPVTVGKLGIEFTPAPAVRLADVRVGGGSSFRADSVSIALGLTTLLDPGHALHDIRISGAMVTTDELRGMFGALAKDSASLNLRSVQGEGVTVVDRYWTVGGLNLQATIGPKGDLGRLVVSGLQGDTRAVFTPATTGLRLEVSSSRIRPFGAEFELHDFSARGTYTSDEIVLNEFDGRVLQGVVKGQARIRAGTIWTAEGTLDARGMELVELSKHLLRDGQFSGKARFTSSTPSPDKLLSVGMLEGSIAADRGTLLGVDVSRIAQGESNTRGTTAFTELVATFRADAGSHQIASNVRFKSNRVSGAATVHVDGRQVLTGQLTAELSTPSGPLRGTVNLSGSPARLALSK